MRTRQLAILWLCSTLLVLLPRAANSQSKTYHYFYVDSAQHVMYLYGTGVSGGYVTLSGAGWADITTLNGGPATESQSSVITGFSDASGEHVFYLGANHHVYHLYYAFNPGKWMGAADLTSLTGAPAAASGSALSSFSDTPGEHLIYLGTNYHVYQLYYNFNAHEWGYGDLTSITGDVPAAAGSALASFFDNSGEHIFFLGTNHHVYQLYFENNVNEWTPVEDLTSDAGAQLAASGSALGGITDQNGEYVIYQDSNHNLWMLTYFYSYKYWQVFEASDSQFAANQGTPIATSVVQVGSGSQDYVFYAGTCGAVSGYTICPIIQEYNGGWYHASGNINNSIGELPGMQLATVGDEKYPEDIVFQQAPNSTFPTGLVKIEWEYEGPTGGVYNNLFHCGSECANAQPMTTSSSILAFRDR